jgi:biotin carboxyl carrier protein
MRLEVQIGGRKRELEIAREGSQVRARVDGRALEADAVEVAEGVYSILLGGQAFEVRVQPDESAEAGRRLRVHAGGYEFAAQIADPRRRRGRGGAVEAEGQQQVSAPMPGKVVRVLVGAGDDVAAGQGLVVVEAMKMQNEIRSPKAGKVERVLVGEGQAVNAGQALIVVG